MSFLGVYRAYYDGFEPISGVYRAYCISGVFQAIMVSIMLFLMPSRPDYVVFGVFRASFMVFSVCYKPWAVFSVCFGPVDGVSDVFQDLQ